MAHQFDHHVRDLGAVPASFTAVSMPKACLIEPAQTGCATSTAFADASRLHQRFWIVGPDRCNEHRPVAPLIPGHLLARSSTGRYASVPSTAAGAEPSPPGAGTQLDSARFGLAW